VRLHASEISRISVCTELDEGAVKKIKSRRHLKALIDYFLADKDTYPELRLLRGMYLPEIQNKLDNIIC